MLRTIVDGSTLLKLVAGALVTGVGVTAAFSVVIYGAARATDMRRRDQMVAAGLFGAIAVLALAVCGALVAYGIQVMVSKS